LLFGELGQIVFANNTSPDPDLAVPIQLFTQPVDTSPPLGPLTAYPAFATTDVGFNFFMAAGDPFLKQIVVYYDPINDLLSAHWSQYLDRGSGTSFEF
jgi:hypothetical protein